MNPTKELSKKLKVAEGDLEQWKEGALRSHSDHNKLKTRHTELIEASCKIENNRDLLKEGVEEFCSECVMRGSEECRECSLHKFLG